ncbi:helix-turn-helix transcriptional regulator [Brenneria corticis]|uniref:HTH araC/xylS-type domain-containing protein n=1 Tax=Brenneria corticis TaxID=2173106 RepID=A0A2U1TYS0_9GAMM|nr:AraC family transcriptional regulator [Brenneria sp. CFCC 11842]PWC14534.1 hypothetical protein DDT56_13535 [Brenneria sp. CFCC 11842]
MPTYGLRHRQTRRTASPLEQYSGCYSAHHAHFIESDCASCPLQCAAGKRKIYLVQRALGEGWTDMHEFDNGIMVGRRCCRLTHPLENEHPTLPDSVSLSFMVSGQIGHGVANYPSLTASAGDILLRTAPGVLRRSVPAGCLLSGVSIDIPRDMFLTLQEQGVDISFLHRHGSYAVLRPTAQMAAGLCQLCQRVLNLQVHNSLLARLELESLTIEILLRFLTTCADAPPDGANALPQRWQRALNEVLEILHAEWNQPLTIAQLARRAGINECYLKKLFRERTGQGIAGYLRRLRMQRAREMIDSGRYTVQHVAQQCGYACASRFTQAFQREYGYSPSRQ